jgi:spermidine/putrescine transport system permease protein
MSVTTPTAPAVREPAPAAPRGGFARAQAARERRARLLQLTPVSVFYAVFFVAPLAIFLLYSFWTVRSYDIVPDWTLVNYKNAVSDPVYRTLMRNTLVIAGIASVCTIAIAYAFAHALRFHLARWQEPLLLLVLVAMFSGYLVRIYAWRTILGNEGIINDGLRAAGLIDQPLSALLYNRWAAVIVLANFSVPVAILPIYAALQNVQDDAIEAARDLGCGWFTAFRRVTLPLAWPGVFFAFALTFVIASGDYVVPQLVGGSSGTMVGKIISDKFSLAFDWPGGAALAFVALACVLLVVTIVKLVGDRVIR